MTENQIREIIVAAGKELVERQLVQGTWGNISVKSGRRHYACDTVGRIMAE